MRAVRRARPRAFMLENVRGMLRQAFLPYFRYVLLQLEYPSVEREPSESWESHQRRLASGKATRPPEYHVTYLLLNAADYGVPQIRWRVVVGGMRADTHPTLAFPSPPPRPAPPPAHHSRTA